ncbi:DNA-dependent RNA polymerase subunit epsilon [Heyndrickxia vini]|uniref:DNA-directed RNA polymerase subunit epsilon n=1 Tax=Heyndrickxia vini TaxID=1476025 RepID=A0ABX7DZX9_9BACI|nr:DNA-directed RNA polymerase subunit epsilon [Heyndrickxia vini]QQZ08097.1 DNA-dependent RNA polymerase auxiliary subunit epsilon family protein [Heyndrickxia vini]
MIYKVYYQESKTEVAVRENTKTMYIEAKSEREVRLSLKNRPFNIEFVQLLEGSYLEYEKNHENFELSETR